MKYIPSVLVVVAGLAGSAAAEPLDAAIARAKVANKPLVVELGAEWCGPCKMFERTVLPDARVKGALGAVVFVRYDVDEDEGKAAGKQLSVRGYPTFVVLGNGVERFRRTGIPADEAGVEFFLDLLDEASGALFSPASLAEALRARRGDLAFELTAARWYEHNKLPREALAHYRAIAAAPRATADQRATAGRAAAHLARVTAWRQQLLDETFATVRADPKRATSDEMILATVGTQHSAADIRAIFRTAFTPELKPSARNELVYIALAAGATDEALAAAEENIKVLRSPQLLDTLAEVHHVRGERDRALAIEDEAIAAPGAAPVAKTLAQNRARFASGRQDAPEVKRARARVDALIARFQSVDELDIVQERNTERFDKFEKAYMARETAKRRTIKNCRRFAGETPRIYARLTLSKDTVGSVAIFSDGEVPSSLRACVQRELRGAPMPSDELGRDPLIEIYFKPAPSDSN